MRAHALNALVGALGLATVAFSAAISSGLIDTCVDPATVFITVPASTVYVTLKPGVEIPTPTVTEYSTIHSTLYLTNPAHTHTQVIDPGTASGAGAETSYETTITQTAVVTVTQVSLTATPSGASLTYSETAASDGLFNFVVDGGTTYWLGGQTPAPSQSFVLLTSAITVYPVEPTTHSTLTIHTTIHSTNHVTLTETLPAPTATTHGSSIYSGMASGGWNATSTAKGVSATGIVVLGPTGTISKPFFTIQGTFDIYHTSHSTISLTSYAAQSGFYASSDHAVTSSADGTLATAVIGGSSLSASTTRTEKSSVYSVVPPPYANSTSVASAAGSVGGIVTSGIAQYPGTGVETSTPVSSSSLPTLVPLGDPCIPSISQCENGASCYAVNSMLQLVCGNFKATCTSNSQCAFNTCVSGFCNGLKSATSTGAPVTSSVKTTNTVPSQYSYVFPTHSNYGVPISASSSSATSSIQSTSYVAPTPSHSQNSSPVATSASSSLSATPTKCGEQGDFVLNFDDIPPLSIANPENSTVQPAPVFNPYHQFDFSDGFTIGPPPKEPYLASSPPLLVEFKPFFNSQGSNSNAGPNAIEQGYTGQISDGDHGLTGCFRFNFYGASLGCNSTGPACSFALSGYQYNTTTQAETLIAMQSHDIPACARLSNCPLTPITLSNAFQDLTHIKINVTVSNKPTVWWMDDLRLGWFDNSCTMGLCRINAHIH